MRKKNCLFYIFICLMLGLTACAKKVPALKLAMGTSIAVAPFNQPTHNTQLLAGYIPDEQGQLYSDYAGRFNALFKERLAKTNRNYIYLTQGDLDISIQKDSKGRDNSLSSWAKLAQDLEVAFILVPQVIDIEERTGDDMYVRNPARLICDFYLIKAYNPELESTDQAFKDGYLQKRSHYKHIIMLSTENDFGERLNSTDRSEVTYFMSQAINKAINDFSL